MKERKFQTRRRTLTQGVNPSMLPDREEEFEGEFNPFFEPPPGFDKHPRIHAKTLRLANNMPCPKCGANDWSKQLKQNSRWKFYIWCVCKCCGYRGPYRPLDTPLV